MKNTYGPINLGILILALSACSSITSTDSGGAFPNRYTLATLESAAPSPSPSPSPHFPVVLGIASISAPVWLDSPRMLYRLEYKTQSPLAAYSQSRWAGSPAAMVEQALRGTFADSGHFKAVTAASDKAADIVLQVVLSDFEQRFASRQRSFGVLDARATLSRSGTDTVLAQQEFHYRILAPDADAAGGVQALSRASSRFTAAVGQWLQHTLSQCRPTCLTSSP